MTRAGGFTRSSLRRAAAAILKAGLDAAAPGPLVRRQLRSLASLRRVRGRVLLVAAGKAAGAMARAAEDVLGTRIDGALVVDSAGPREALRRARVLLAGHPVPDRRGLEAARDVERLAASLRRDDLLLLLLSGGASALLPAPVEGVSLEDKARVTALLLRSGAPIGELNAVRKHLSRLKGGGLARVAAPARVLALVLSDVVGDDLGTIASGPVSPDPTTYADALRILRSRGLWSEIPTSARRYLAAGARGARPETLKPGDPRFGRVAVRAVGSGRLSVAAAVREARRQGLRPLVLTTRLEGEAREVARALVAVLRECVDTGRPVRTPACLLAAGETTVTVLGDGRGGRNQELVTAAAAALDGFPGAAVVASLATDGSDGRSEAAGGIVDDRTASRARGLGLPPPAAFLAESDATRFLAPLAGLIVTGPTGTNVADLVVLLAAGVKGRG